MKYRWIALFAAAAALTSSRAIAGDAANPDIAITNPPPAQFEPMTRSERLANYATHLADPESILSSAISGGIRQAENTPKEWGGGAEGYGDRVGSAFAQHIIQRTLMDGSAWALHQDNRYFASGESGFVRRTRYALVSTLLARRDDGSQTFSYSRIGGTAGAAFLSRLWQPRSTTSAGDGAVSFGIGMATQMGFNVVREFLPDLKHRFRK